MKAILEFDLENPQDESYHKLCIDSVDLYIILMNINKIYYSNEPVTNIAKELEKIDWNRYPD